jgi:ribonucleotide reductase beta subunit family protein with ferritin-like domain
MSVTQSQQEIKINQTNQNNLTEPNLIEPLLTPENERYSIFPIRYPVLWEAYKKQLAAVWVVNEVKLDKDIEDWNRLNKDERHFLKMVLAFFSASDLLVNENLDSRFTDDVKILEAKFAYGFQQMMENIHSEMYSLLIDTYIKDSKEKDFLFNAVKNVPIIGKKAAWAKKWMNSTEPFAQRLVAFSAVEGIFFSGSFCAIYWVKERGLLPGLTKSNEFIARDEGMHTDFAVLLHSMLNSKCPVDTLHTIIKEAVEIEKEFITEALPCSLIGMNSENMKNYIEFVANRLVLQYGYPEIYPESKCPFEFMHRMNLKGKTNFFEKTVTDYNQGSTQHLEADDPYADL